MAGSLSKAMEPMSKNDEARLTPKQEAFANAYLKTGNAVESYRIAYDAEDMSYKAIDKEARKLLEHPGISLILAQASKRAQERAVVSFDEHVAELKTLRELAKQNGQISAAIKAEELRGRLFRYYIEQVEHGGAGEFAHMSDEELDAYLGETEVPAQPAKKSKANGKANGHVKH